MTETIELAGRRDEPTITVRGQDRDVLFELVGAELTQRKTGLETWTIRARHDSGTDFEHDSASMAVLEGVALTFDHMQYGQAHFTGYMTEGRWYDSHTIMAPGMRFDHCPDSAEVTQCDHEQCKGDRAHLLMPYMPPARRFKPQEITITVSYNRFIKSDDES